MENKQQNVSFKPTYTNYYSMCKWTKYPIKRQRWSDGVKRENIYIYMLSKETHLNIKTRIKIK